MKYCWILIYHYQSLLAQNPKIAKCKVWHQHFCKKHFNSHIQKENIQFHCPNCNNFCNFYCAFFYTWTYHIWLKWITNWIILIFKWDFIGNWFFLRNFIAWVDFFAMKPFHEFLPMIFCHKKREEALLNL